MSVAVAMDVPMRAEFRTVRGRWLAVDTQHEPLALDLYRRYVEREFRGYIGLGRRWRILDDEGRVLYDSAPGTA